MEEMAWYIPLAIFLGRIGDVSIGTVRSIVVISGRRYLAATLGFFEVIIWIFAVGGALAYLAHPTAVIGYAGGYATGVLVGMLIEEKIALGHRMVRIVNTNLDDPVANKLQEAGYKLTRVDGHGAKGPVEVIFAAVSRKKVPEVRRLVAEVAPDAFMTVEWVNQPSTAQAPPANGLGSRFGRQRWIGRGLVRK